MLLQNLSSALKSDPAMFVCVAMSSKCAIDAYSPVYTLIYAYPQSLRGVCTAHCGMWHFVLFSHFGGVSLLLHLTLSLWPRIDVMCTVPASVCTH